MERSIKTYLSLLLAIMIVSYIITQSFTLSLAITSMPLLLILLVSLMIGKSTNDEILIINIRKVKYVNHPRNKTYFIYYDGDGEIKLYKSNLFYSKYIYTYYSHGKKLDIDDLCRELLFEIDNDMDEYNDTIVNTINNWSGALTRDQEREDSINNILK